MKNQWTSGPALVKARSWHSCLYDEKTNSIFIMGGVDKNYRIMKSTEKLNLDNNMIWTSRIPLRDLHESLYYSAAVASNSTEFIGYVAGGKTGFGGSGGTDKVWGLRRIGLTWEEIPIRLQTPRFSHTIVNLASNEKMYC